MNRSDRARNLGAVNLKIMPEITLFYFSGIGNSVHSGHSLADGGTGGAVLEVMGECGILGGRVGA